MLVSLAILRRCINHHDSRICNIPTEILPLIASHLTSDLVTATHVCHHLRVALLSSPTLWSYIDGTRVDRGVTFLGRSGSVPLHVDLTRPMDSPRGGEMIDGSTLEVHARRIATLKVDTWTPQVQEALLSTDMPSLRTLEFKSVLAVGGPGLRISTRNLHHLTSLGLKDQLPSHLCTPHLTRLAVELTAGFFGTQENTQDITNDLSRFLGTCPLLEHMEIRWYEHITATPAKIISLPNLRTFTHVVTNSEYTSVLLNALSLPPSCRVTLQSSVWMDSEWSLPAVLIPTFRDQSYLTEVKRIRLSAANNRVDPAMLFPGIGLISDKGNGIALERSMYVLPQTGRIDPSMDAHIDMAYLGCLEYLNMSSAEVLCLHGYELRRGGGGGQIAVKRALGCLKSLTTLILSNSATSSFLSELLPDPEGSCGPKIHTLVIHTRARTSFRSEDVLKTVLSVARERKAAGIPFKSVSVFIRHFDECEPDLLEALTGCIERFELVMGDGVLDWDLDKYFLDGLGDFPKRS